MISDLASRVLNVRPSLSGRKASALAAVLAAASLAACASTPPPAPAPAPAPVETPEPVIEPVEKPVEPVEEASGLIPPHMEGRDLARIALLLPFSSDNSGARAESIRLLRAAELALFERAGGNLVMIPKDTQGTPEGARAAARAAVEDGADLIIGPLFASAVTAAGEVARTADVPVIALSTDSSAAGDGVYLLSFPPEIEVARIVEFAARQGVWKFGYLGSQNRYGMAVYNALQNSVETTMGEVTSEAFYTGDVEAMARASARLAEGLFEQLTPEQADELRRREWIPDPEAPFQAVILPEGGTRLRTLGPLLIGQSVDPLVVRFLGTGLWMDEELLREPALRGGWFAGPDLDGREQFEASYEAAFGSEPSRIASLGYDALALAAHLDGGELGFSREAIEHPDGFYGADGLFRFTDAGMIERGLAIYEMRSRGFREIEPAPESFDQPLVDPLLLEELRRRREEEMVIDVYSPAEADRIRLRGANDRGPFDPVADPSEEDPEAIDYTLFRREMPEDYPRPGEEEDEDALDGEMEDDPSLD